MFNGGQFLSAFGPDGIDLIPDHFRYGDETHNNFNFSIDNSGLIWNIQSTVPRTGGVAGLPLKLPICNGFGSPTPYCNLAFAGNGLAWAGDSWSYDNPLTMTDTIVGVLIDTTTTGFNQPQTLGTATAVWSSASLDPSAGYAMYPDFSAAPLSPLTPGDDGADGPKAYFDPFPGTALISAAINGGTGYRQTQLHVMTGALHLTGSGGSFVDEPTAGFPCLGAPNSPDCQQLMCVNVSPSGLAGSLPLGPRAITATSLECGTNDSSAAPGSRYNSAWVTHAPVVGEEYKAWVVFMLDDPAYPNHPFPVLAVVDYYNDRIAWYKVIDNQDFPLLPCPSGHGSLECLPDCLGTLPIRLSQHPALAWGTDPTGQLNDVLYVAWNSSHQGAKGPVEGITVVALDIHSDLPFGSNGYVTVRNVSVPSNQNHNEYMPALSASMYDPGKVVLVYYSDEGSGCGTVDCPTNACQAHAMACMSPDSGGAASTGGGYAQSDLGLICSQISGAFPIETTSTSAGGNVMTDYLGATFMATQPLVLASWVQADNMIAPTATAGAAIGASGCPLTNSDGSPTGLTGVTETSYVAAIDPPTIPSQCLGEVDNGSDDLGDDGSDRGDGQGKGCDSDGGCGVDDEQGRGAAAVCCSLRVLCEAAGADAGAVVSRPTCVEGSGCRGGSGEGADDGSQGEGEGRGSSCGDDHSDGCESDGKAPDGGGCAALEAQCLLRARTERALVAALGPAAIPAALAVADLPVVRQGILPPGRFASTCRVDTDCPAAQGSICVRGRCGCPLGLTVCGPMPAVCADLHSDRDHCGTCGTLCPTGQGCDAGVCGP
ncbi:MAG: hypothetical protein ACYCWW_04945 [Deltaproteobacteria bacterium]